MLQISENQININTESFKSFKKLDIGKANIRFKRMLWIFIVLTVIVLFLPWTQNIQAKGKITTLTPDLRPQTIHATIAGRVEKWHVTEGQLMRKGDTIVTLSEIKTEYFDPQLLQRTQAQVQAKENSVNAYDDKIKALDNQIVAMEGELKFKLEQLNNKISQTRLKAEGERNEWEAAKIDLKTEQAQLVRTEEMFKQGIKSLTDVENKRLKLQQVQAKAIASENKYQASIQEMENLTFQLSGAKNEYAGKIAKTKSEKFSTLSDRLEAEGSVNKLKNQYSNYSLRAGFYTITAPQDCYISLATTAGIGETVKEGEAVVSIVPSKMNLAVELFIEPIDLPLVRIGEEVRFIFDGWPAFIFSGWPNSSVGTFAGKIVAVDNVTNTKGQYRILVAPDEKQHKWPAELRPGSGAMGFALLNDVPMWYELWRQLNGFPADYYKDLKDSAPNGGNKKDKDKK